MSTSSTTPASSKTPAGQCVVCGKETYLRCGPCNRFGTDWMFFCSIEHQQLIWKRHRHVCGPRSKPFQFPEFNQSEIEECKKYVLYPVLEDGRQTGKTQLDTLYDGFFKGNFTNFGILVDSLREGGEASSSFKDEFSLLCDLRAWLFDMRVHSAIHENPLLSRSGQLLRHNTKAHPFDWIARWVRDLDRDGDYSSSGPAWTSEFLHRQLIFHYLLEQLGDDHPYTRSAYKRIAELAEQVIQKTHPRLAERLLEKKATRERVSMRK
ncbi:hypothetical protein JCM5350_000722 [Sporobolomyces pararoseus]